LSILRIHAREVAPASVEKQLNQGPHRGRVEVNDWPNRKAESERPDESAQAYREAVE